MHGVSKWKLKIVIIFLEQKLKIFILLNGLCLGLKEVWLENDWNWMKISNFIQNKGLENSFSFILLVPHKSNTITFLFFYFFSRLWVI